MTLSQVRTVLNLVSCYLIVCQFPSKERLADILKTVLSCVDKWQVSDANDYIPTLHIPAQLPEPNSVNKSYPRLDSPTYKRVYDAWKVTKQTNTIA